MTEDEAKTKWCPERAMTKESRLNSSATLLVSSPSVDGLKGYGDLQDDNFQKCIGSGCMMWVPRSKGMRCSGNGDAGGYCGLAGMASK